MQTLGHDDAVGGLIVLEEGGDDAWEGKGAAVEGVGETHLAVGVLETEFQSSVPKIPFIIYNRNVSLNLKKNRFSPNSGFWIYG